MDCIFCHKEKIVTDIVYEDNLNKDAIGGNSYYTIVLSDTLPEENVDGVYDLATISTYKDISVSDE